MIEVRYKSRLGNNLFQYCLGRILAEELGFALHAEAIAGFPNTAHHVDGVRGEAPEQTLTGHRIDLQGILTDRSPRRIVLEGWFQCHEYYRPYRTMIREWLAFDPSINVSNSTPDVVVHVRRTDYVRRGWALPFSYYEEALERVLAKDGRVCIATDDRQDPFLGNFERWRPQILSGTGLEQMALMAQGRRLIMSQSTFSWWAAFLGNPEDVVCPLPVFGVWSNHGAADGPKLIERDRFLCLECREPYLPTNCEALYQRRRKQWPQIVRALKSRLALPKPRPGGVPGVL